MNCPHGTIYMTPNICPSILLWIGNPHVLLHAYTIHTLTNRYRLSLNFHPAYVYIQVLDLLFSFMTIIRKARFASNNVSNYNVFWSTVNSNSQWYIWTNIVNKQYICLKYWCWDYNWAFTLSLYCMSINCFTLLLFYYFTLSI